MQRHTAGPAEAHLTRSVIRVLSETCTIVVALFAFWEGSFLFLHALRFLPFVRERLTFLTIWYELENIRPTNARAKSTSGLGMNPEKKISLREARALSPRVIHLWFVRLGLCY